ncbi:uncharacterized protein LOC143853153 [Tasmannia lanceolata]|uniref:uncharacterized protein LOC143853153 n=1 Tax=Tasmannia lanceolata TaxID=3420 RepID=UPI004062B1F6
MHMLHKLHQFFLDFIRSRFSISSNQPWHPKGTLRSFFSRLRVDSYLGSAALLSQVHSNDCRNLILDNPSLSQEKKLLVEAIFSPGKTSSPTWKPSTTDGCFSTRCAWNTYRMRVPKPPWSESLWFKGHVPRYSLVVCKAMLKKLSTKDRLSFKGPDLNPICVLCNAVPESADHLFFRCGYKACIWRSILWRYGSRRKTLISLQAEEEWMRLNAKGDGQVATTLRCSFSSAIYKIWAERNRRIF